MWRARAAAADWKLPPVTVLLGRRVAHAFRCQSLEWLEWYFRPEPASPWELAEDAEIQGLARWPWEQWAVVIPHPSGLNRKLNDPETRHYVGEILRQAAQTGTVTA